MALISINYSLYNKPLKNHQLLGDAIKSASNGCYLHCLESFWLISCETPVTEIFKQLSRFMKKDDSLVVMKVTSNYKCFLPQKSIDWIQSVSD